MTVIMSQSKIRAVIVDDESVIRNVTRTLLTRYFSEQIEIVAEAESVESALVAIRTTAPQLLFLDVELQDGIGFEILDLLGDERKKCHVIVITSHGTKFIHRAMRQDAVDYLNKPLEPEEFKIGVERTIAKIRESQPAEQPQTPAVKRNTMLSIRNNTGAEAIVPVSTIVCCKADSNYTQIVLLDKHPITASKTLRHYEEILVKYGFVRVARNLVINPEHCQIKLDKRNLVSVELPDGSREQVDPAYQESVRKEFLDVVV